MVEKRSRRHQTLAPKILANLEGSIDWKNANWLTWAVHLTTKILESSDENPGVNLVARSTDGIFVYYKDKIDHYLHFRQKHILIHSHEDTLIASSGDSLFGEESRHRGSWHSMWRLNKPEQIQNLVNHIQALPKISIPEDETTSRAIPGWVREFVFERDNRMCRAPGCMQKNGLHFDHILPFSMGGGNHPKNIQLLCEKHNLEKSASHKY